MNNLKYLKELVKELTELTGEIYSMGLMSVNNNTLEEIKRCEKLCDDCGFTFAATSLNTLYTGLSKSLSRLDKDYSKEAEELLLLNNWLSLISNEINTEEVRNLLLRGNS